MRIAFAYDEWLDDWGRKQVGDVVNNEIAQCKELKKSWKSQSESSEIVYFKVPGYMLPVSAGPGELAGQEQPEDFQLVKAAPRGTSYIAHVSGDSMEPTYHDGDRLFVRATVDIQLGQVGVFFIDGKMWVKELGDNVLISHNSAYAPIQMREDVKCQGLVLGVCDESYFE